jgi:hypothetical protein
MKMLEQDKKVPQCSIDVIELLYGCRCIQYMCVCVCMRVCVTLSPSASPPLLLTPLQALGSEAKVYLLVGVCSDKLTREFKGKTVWPQCNIRVTSV